MHLLLWQWAILVTASFLIGVSKTGITGLSTFAVALFALVLPTRSSVGIVLVILISADVIAVTLYRHHAIWSHLWRLFPWAAAGIILGYFAIGRIDDRQVSTLVGTILLVMAVVQWWRQRRTARGAEDIPDSFWFAATIGMLAGFTTMVANAAGPIMVLYLLAMRLPKMAFIGTAAWYFFCLNLFKIPFSYQLGLINPASLLLDLRLAPAAVIGAISGRAIIPRINQHLFERLALILTVLAALKLLY